MIWWILLGIFIVLFVIPFFLSFYICYKFVFGKLKNKGNAKVPEGKIYEPYHDEMTAWYDEVEHMPCKDVYVKSFDGLTLHAKYIEYEPGAPMEIMFHGYRGNALRDLSGGVYRCLALKRSILLVDHRSCGESEGKTTTFGVLESRDCVTWIDYVINNIDKNAKIILSGVSMGATTVMIASSFDLPPNVVGVIADCGFTSAKEIIMTVMKKLKLPVKLFYWFTYWGARIFGKFDLEELSPIEAMKKCKLPIIFFHGDNDQFVPHYMSVENYDACTSDKKQLVTIPGAAHGIAFLVDREKYFDALNEFFADVL